MIMKNNFTFLMTLPKHIITELLKLYEKTDFTIEQIFKNIIASHIKDLKERQCKKTK